MESLAQTVESQIEIKKSFFYGFVAPVADEAQALAMIQALRERFAQANHVCYAYVLEEGRIVRAFDDGEPKHTAGMPMLGVLQKQDLTQVCAVVVREFGGIKLGASGLVRAYTKAVSEALQSAVRVQKVALVGVQGSLSYAQHNRVDALLNESLEALKLTFDAHVTFEGTLLKGHLERFGQQLNETLGTTLELSITHETSTYR